VHFPRGFFVPGIRWYGLAYAVGFLIAASLLWLYAKKRRLPLNADQRSELLFALIAGVCVGGRLGSFLLYHPDELMAHPLDFFKVWQGGMASHGGFIGATIAIWWFGRASKLGFARIADAVATLAPPGLLLGRLANFVNGELWGKVTNVAWAVIFPIRDAQGVIVAYTEPRHPSQLYEAALEGLLLMIYTQWRWWSGPPPGAAGSRPSGQLAGEFIIAYALVRVIGETFREPDASLILGLSRGTFYSLFMFVIGMACIVVARRARVR
jgi:phosphatidylglycerol:prolipoprotein diacylglycerol transferase